jgi:hypothetical protein
MVEQHAADTLQPFLDQLREALTAVANGDPEPMKALCSHSDAISQCGFWGGVESGWAEVSERWDWVAAQFVPGPGVVTSDTAYLTVSGEMALGSLHRALVGAVQEPVGADRDHDPSHPDLPARGWRLEGCPSPWRQRRGQGAAKLTPSGVIHPSAWKGRCWRCSSSGGGQEVPPLL